MRVMVMVKANKDSEAGVMPSQEMLAAMGNFNEELVNAGIMKAGEGLKPSSAGKKVRFEGDKRAVIDGPFAEAKELIAGFSVIEAASLAEVVDLVKQWPQSDGRGNVQVEIRQIAAADDLGFSDEQKERYDKMVVQGMQQQQ
jgi:hypothetical protein